MQRTIALAALIGALGATGAHAEAAAYDQAFVDAFAEACVPGRLGYDSTQEAAKAAGWSAVERTDSAELDAMMAISERAATDPELQATFDYRLYRKDIEALPHYLVVSRSTAVIDDESDPWVLIGCYLYNLDAAAPIDPAPVTELIGNPIANSQSDMHLTGYIWGPPCPMPRTGDTYLTFIPEVSQYREQTGFSGLVLKFDTSEPDPDEVVPDTYC